MTRDDIIRMAREAGFVDGAVDIIGLDGFANFANLVAAAEREACAIEADYEAEHWPYESEFRELCEEIAKAIRARGEK